VSTTSPAALARLTRQIKAWGLELGFQQIGIAPAAVGAAEGDLQAWLAAGYHGAMDYMARHGLRRSRPAELVPGTVRVIVARMDYWPAHARPAAALLDDGQSAYLARYSLGRDYHKVLRRRLQRLAGRIEAQCGPFGYRVFVDSGPVMEKPLAALAGLGWQGKHTNLINRQAGSWFLLGTILTDLPLSVDSPAEDHCGSCRACIDVCPTQAIVAPYRLDARRCISYLTIESRGPIPLELRTAIGNRVFGCDDCQLVCPWNKFATPTQEQDFTPRHGLDTPDLVTLFDWDETTWQQRTEGSALRRPGYQGWLRNLAVALGNAPPSARIQAALRARLGDSSALVQEHVQWALKKQATARN
jgi:epoxyqueuosine reductase